MNLKLLKSPAAKGSVVLMVMLLILSFTSIGSQTFNIQTHDTYIVLHFGFVCLVTAAFFAISALLYEVAYSIITESKGNAIQITQLFVNVLCFGSVTYGLFALQSQPRRYHSFSDFATFDNFNFFTQVVAIVSIVFALSNLLFGIYYLWCVFRKLTGRHPH